MISLHAFGQTGQGGMGRLIYGMITSMDGDGPALADAAPRHNGTGRASHTFGEGVGPPPPAALDRILLTDSKLALLGAFVLNTTALDAGSLARLMLEATDVLLNATTRRFDHLPVIVDLRARQP